MPILSRLRCLAVCLALCLAAGLCPSDTAHAEAEAAKQVLLCLAEDLPENLPYATSLGEYSRDAVTPLLSGAKGFLYKRNADVNIWMFPVSYTLGTPTLFLSLEGLPSPVSVSVNNTPLTRDRPVAVPLGQTADLRVANGRRRAVIRLLFTTLPIVRMEPAGNVYKDQDTACTITVSDPDYRLHGLSEQVVTYEGVMSRRGRSSSRYANKHPYNFSLMRDGKKWDQSLLGMRIDSDWLLDSAYNDRSRMRNRVLMDVWHEIYRLPWDQTLSGATRGVFVELYVGEAYRGLYVLGEKQDRRQLGLAKTGGKWNSLFLRTGAAGMDGSSPAGFLSLGRSMPGAAEPFRWYNVDLRYPQDSSMNVQTLWADFYEYVKLVVRGSADEFAANITRYADLDNLAYYWLFANAMDLTDNMRKNMTFARLDDRDERFNRFILLPWDMDSSLGRYYSSKSSRVEEVVTNRLFERLFRENPHDFRGTVRRLWQTLRAGPLSADSVMARFDGYFAPIHESGADRREIEKFPTFKSYVKAGYSYELDFEAEFRYIRRYTEKRLQWLDGQVEALCGEE